MTDLITSKKELRYGINKLMELYFNQPNIIYQHLFSSYHQLIEDIIPYVLEKDTHNFYEHVDKTNLYIYGFEFKKTRILPPVRERDNEIIFPQMARKNYLNYFSNINVECRQVQEKIDLITGERTRKYIGDSEDVSIASIPVMVKSKYCATNLKPETSKYECKYDPGGYFIVGGQEKVVVCIEKMIDNKVLVFGKTDSSYASGKMYTAQINSRKHDWSENLQIIAIRNNKDDSISLTTSQFSEVPVFVLIRALGVETDREIISRITNNLEDVRMINILRNSLEQSVDEEGNYIRTTEEAVNYLINKMKAGRRVSQTDEEVAKAQKKLLFEKIITKDFLPHLGTDVETKAAFICLMIKKLLLVMMGRVEEDDRDAFENKRVETPGVLIGQLFRQNLAKMLKNIGKLFRKKNNSDDSPINVVSQIKPTDIEQGIKSGLATGVWGMSKTKAGVAQSLSRLTWLQTISYLRRIKSPSMDTSTAKLTSIRQINNIQAFFVCNIETPEGQPIGLAKSLALMSTVTPNLQVQTDLVNELIEKHPKMTHPFRTNPEDIDNMIKVFHNGKWSGVINIKDGITFFDNLKQMRRTGKLSKMVSVTMDYIQKDLLIYTEAGRLIRPLLNVKDNRIQLTKKMIKDINSETTGEKKNMGWNNIMLKYPDLIDYEDIESSRNIMIAMDLEMLEDNKTNEDRKITSKESVIKPNRYTKNRYVKYTHSEFHPYVMLGTIVSTVPFINHNQAPRGIIYFSQAKQAMGVYSTAYKDRMDISNILYHPQIPLTTTKGMKYNRFLDLPSGENAIVAIMSYTGYNVEDSIIMNQTAIDRGLFRCDTVRKYNSKIEKNPSTSRDDMFMKPDRNKVTGMSRGNYEKLSDKGFIPEETEINNNDVLIGKVSPIQPTSDNKVYKDKSELFKTNVPGVVDRVHKDIFNADGYEMCSIRVRMEREPIIGDKFSNFHGQKGTVGITLPQMDMPFTKEGISPDIIFNPHGMPSRMTMGQLSETLSSKIAANTGALFDGTPFSDYDVMELPKMLKELGYNEYGTEEMYCGMTGRKMKAQVFIGPVYYLRLKHMVKDKLHCLTPNHEVLTNNGWKKIDTVEKQDKIACLVNNELQYHNYKQRYDYDYKGKMYQIKTQQVNQVVTPNHKMFVSKLQTRKAIWSEYKFEEAKDIFGKHRKYKRDAEWNCKDYQFILPSIISNSIKQDEINVNMDAWLTFFGIWIAEGWCEQVNVDNARYKITIAANKQRVKDALFDAFDKLDFKYYHHNKSDKVSVNSKQLYEYMKKFSVGAPNKYLPDWVWQLSKTQCQLLIHSMCLGDGCFKKNTDIAELYYTSSRKLADDFMRLCLHAGWSCNKTIHNAKGYESHIRDRKVISNYDLLRLRIVRTKNKPAVNHSHSKNYKITDEKWIDYEGKVYCFEVPGNVFYIRKDGIPGWTGNSRSTGPRQAITRQPMEGRSKDGGLKIGSHFAEKSVLQLLASPSIAGNILKLRETPVKIKKLSLLFINNIRKYIWKLKKQLKQL